MNNKRRSVISDAKGTLSSVLKKIENVLEEENESMDNMPEPLKYSSRYIDMEDSTKALEDSIENIEKAIDNLSEVV